ncbi:MAG: TolC family protein [Vicinamibacterales bacterium]
MSSLKSGGAIQRLTLSEAIRLTLERHPAILVEKIAPRLQAENIAEARAVFVPTVVWGASHARAETPPDSFLSGAGDVLKDDASEASLGLRQSLPKGGGRYEVSWTGSRGTTNNVFSTFEPRLRSELAISYTQPLARNALTDANRTRWRSSRRSQDIADANLRATVAGAVRSVTHAYWDLVFAIANADVQRQNLAFARRALGDDRQRAQVGTLAAIDLVESEAEVALDEEAVLVAEADARDAEDRLRTLVFDPQSAEFWQTQIVPVDTPRLDAVGADVDEAVHRALERRTDLRDAAKAETRPMQTWPDKGTGARVAAGCSLPIRLRSYDRMTFWVRRPRQGSALRAFVRAGGAP